MLIFILIQLFEKHEAGKVKNVSDHFETCIKGLKQSNVEKMIALLVNWSITLRKKCPYWEFFWLAFFQIRTEYGELLCKSLEKYGLEKLRIWTLFTQCQVNVMFRRKRKKRSLGREEKLSIACKSISVFTVKRKSIVLK